MVWVDLLLEVLLVEEARLPVCDGPALEVTLRDEDRMAPGVGEMTVGIDERVLGRWLVLDQGEPLPLEVH